jgi:hypothetical protein
VFADAGVSSVRTAAGKEDGNVVVVELCRFSF